MLHVTVDAWDWQKRGNGIGPFLPSAKRSAIGADAHRGDGSSSSSECLLLEEDGITVVDGLSACGKTAEEGKQWRVGCGVCGWDKVYDCNWNVATVEMGVS
jgi:hypothetical protein